MTTISMTDVMAASYSAVEPPAPMTRANSALLLIDIQTLATPEHLAQQAVKAGLEATAVEQAVADYKDRFYAAVDNCALLLAAARSAQIPRIHVKIEALSADGRDTGGSHRRLGWCYPPGSQATQFLPEVAPKVGEHDGEIVISKTVSGAFTATNLDAVLRHMGIERLIIAGFETDECIEATGRAALDLGYIPFIAEDACTAYERHAHDAFMGKYASWGLTRSSKWLQEKMASLG